MKNMPLTSRIYRSMARLDLRSALILAVVILFTVLLLGGNWPPAAFVSAQATLATPAAETPPPVEDELLATPIPEEYLSNNTQTNGIVLGSVVLVLIVIGGTLSIMLRKPDAGQGKPDSQRK